MVYKHTYFPFSEKQDRLLEEFTAKRNLEVIPFGPPNSAGAPQFLAHYPLAEMQLEKACAAVMRAKLRRYDMHYGNTVGELFF